MEKEVAMLLFKNLSKRYGSHVALDQLSFSVPKGSIFGLVGQNGAGKTSLIRMITQILLPDEGSVYFDGEALNRSHIGRIGYLPEERGLYKNMSIREYLLYIAQLRDLKADDAKRSIEEGVEKFNLTPWLKKDIGSLSKGMQQKVQFLATILHDPELIILDEPFSGFDPVNQELLTQEIKRLNDSGKTILFSTHRMESIEEMCSHVAFIHHSQCLMCGTVKDVKAQYASGLYALVYKIENAVMEVEVEQEDIWEHLASLKCKSAELVSLSVIEHTMKEIFIKVVDA